MTIVSPFTSQMSTKMVVPIFTANVFREGSYQVRMLNKNQKFVLILTTLNFFYIYYLYTYTPRIVCWHSKHFFMKRRHSIKSAAEPPSLLSHWKLQLFQLLCILQKRKYNIFQKYQTVHASIKAQLCITNLSLTNTCKSQQKNKQIYWFYG